MGASTLRAWKSLLDTFVIHGGIKLAKVSHEVQSGKNTVHSINSNTMEQ